METTKLLRIMRLALLKCKRCLSMFYHNGFKGRCAVVY